MYKPNFCADCGTRITRSRWHAWTSRRFCQPCARRFRKAQILFPIIVGATLFAVGLTIGRAIRPAPPPLIIEQGHLAPLATMKTGAQTSGTADGSGNASPKPAPSYGPDGTPTERPTDPDEIISICGARTKKGTPCQRRVRGTGRCWQHIGMPAIIPLEKRVLTGK
jgi:hypothetical protein